LKVIHISSWFGGTSEVLRRFFLIAQISTATGASILQFPAFLPNQTNGGKETQAECQKGKGGPSAWSALASKRGEED
jgi:hypothetical protein